MNELVTVNDGKPVTTSLKVAEVFGKEHAKVLRSIESLECSPEFNRANFGLVEYTDAKNEKRPSYNITRDGFVFLAMGFTGKKAAQFKETYIAEFNRMENSLKQISGGGIVAEIARVMKETLLENARLQHDVAFLSHFKPNSKPGEIAKNGLPKNQFRRGFFCSKNGKNTCVLLEHPTLPGLYEEYKQVQA